MPFPRPPNPAFCPRTPGRRAVPALPGQPPSPMNLKRLMTTAAELHAHGPRSLQRGRGRGVVTRPPLTSGCLVTAAVAREEAERPETKHASQGRGSARRLVLGGILAARIPASWFCTEHRASVQKPNLKIAIRVKSVSFHNSKLPSTIFLLAFCMGRSVSVGPRLCLCVSVCTTLP